jgi:hypothetical protein
MEEVGNYCIMNTHGFVIEKSDSFNTSINGQINDIVQKSRKILNTDSIKSIEIFFDQKTVMIKDNSATDLNITTIVNSEKK